MLALSRTAPARDLRRVPGAVLALSGEPVAGLNYIHIDAGPDPAAHLRAFVEIAGARRLPFVVMVHPDATATIAPVAAELGLSPAGTLPLLLYDARALPEVPGTAVVRRVERDADLLVATSIWARTYALPEEALRRTWGTGVLDTPGVEIFLASRGAAALGAVMTVRHGTMVSIWCMATLPEQQRSGVGRAVLTQVMDDHRRAGVDCFFLLATEAGYPLYTHLGFRTVLTPAVWVAGQSTQVHGA